jgi:amino acid adenylation domain-containing protein
MSQKAGIFDEIPGLSARQQSVLEKILKGELSPTLKKDQVPKRTVHSPVPLSFSQQRLWVLDRLVPGNPFYNLPTAFQLTGEVDIPVLEQSINEVIRRHESLRTVFTMEDEEPVQVILSQLKIKLESIDLQGLSPGKQEEETHRLAAQEASKPFNLARGPLVRAILLIMSKDKYALLFNMHHIIFDGWSVLVFIRELAAIYMAFSVGKPSPLPEPPLQYADFAAWQRQRVQGEIVEKQLSYWRELLSGELPILELPEDLQRPAVSTYQGGYQAIELSIALTDKLTQLNQQEACSMFMTLLAAFNVLLYRFSSQADILVGSPIANRNKSELEEIIGFFANTLVFRTDLSGNPRFRQLLARVRKVTSGAYDNQDLPFEKLVEEFQPHRYMSHTPFFQVMFNFLDAPEKVKKTDVNLSNLSISTLPIHNKTSKFDFWLTLQPKEDKLVGGLEYNTDIFEQTTITRFIQYFNTLLEGITQNPDQRICDLSLLTGEEKTQILVQWNDTGRKYDIMCLHYAFQNQVERTPDHTALIGQIPKGVAPPAYKKSQIPNQEASCGQVLNAFGENSYITYKELNKKANQLAYILQKRGIKSDTIVGIMAERSLEMVIGLLGILKAGGAYMPIDPEYPEDRINYMLKDSSARILVTAPGLSEKFEKLLIVNCQLLMVNEKPSNRRRLNNPPQEANSINNYQLTINNLQLEQASLAYIIYTSGSTGKPKGVMVPHEGISNRLHWMQETFQLTPDDRVLQKTPFTFDVSVWEFFWPLLNGAVLVMAKPGGHKDCTYLVETIQQEKITTIHFVPSMLQVFLEEPGLEEIPSLKRVISSGEALPTEYVERFYRCFTADVGTGLYNLYGPTEASVDVTHWQCSASDDYRSVPLGRPIANTRIFILDRNLNPVPIGVHGELHIGGIQLARGYLNRPELTAEKFVELEVEEDIYHRSYTSYTSYIIYKTGDLARWLPDGNIEFLGRLDFQVKVRGFRIELGEIESKLRNHPCLEDAVVLAREDITGSEPGENKITAYIVPAHDYWISLKETPRTNLARDQVSDWEGVFNDTYHQNSSHRDPSFNILGWTSSYTGAPIPGEEMHQWVDYTIERILDLKPGSVLEIGCGTGLLLFKIIPYCEFYLGTDISEKGLDYIRHNLSSMNQKQNAAAVELMHKPAHDFQGIGVETFDLVILNSVVQYFPGIDYLLNVLKGAAETLKPGGSIFIGDVRSLPLLKTFHASVEFCKAASNLSTTRDQLNRKVMTRMYQEKELVIDPEFFTALTRDPSFSSIRQVELHLKRGQYHNELTRFRYDVILRIAPAPGNHPQKNISHPVMDWQADNLALSSVSRVLKNEEPGSLEITGIPNGRITGDLRILNWLKSQDDVETAAQFLDVIPDQQDMGVDPEDFWHLGKEFPYHIDVLLESASDIGRFRVVFKHRERLKNKTQHTGEYKYADTPRIKNKNVNIRPWNTYANNPLIAKLGAELVPELRNHIKEKLPEYMIPSYFILLETLPLTPNGKLDRRALPLHETLQLTPGQEKELIQPQTDTEKLLAELWKQVLGIEEIGITNNFFELGGDSINAIQVISRANKQGVNLSIQHLYQNQTIADLARYVDQHHHELTAAKEVFVEVDPHQPLVNIDKEHLLRHLPPDVEIEDIYPLTPFQKQMLSHYITSSSREDEPGVFVFQMLSRLKLASADILVAKEAFRELVDIYSYLRTGYMWEEVDEPILIVYKKGRAHLEYLDWSHLSPAEQDKQVHHFAAEDRCRGFERDKPLVYRITLIKLGEEDFFLVLTGDYMRVDGWSSAVIREKFFYYSMALKSGQSFELKNDRSYRGYLGWVSQQDQAKGEDFWKQMIHGCNVPTPLIDQAPQNAAGQRKEKGFTAQHIYFSQEETDKIDSFLKQNHLVLSALGCAVWSLILNRYTSEENVIFGVLLSGRSSGLAMVERMVGQVLNILPTRVNLSQGKPVLTWLKEIWDMLLELNQYEHNQQDIIRKWWEIPPEIPLFESYFALDNYPDIKKEIKNTADLLPEETPVLEYVAQLHYPLRVEIFQRRRLRLSMHYYQRWFSEDSYYQRWFSEDSIKTMINDFYDLTAAIIKNPNQTLGKLMN